MSIYCYVYCAFPFTKFVFLLFSIFFFIFAVKKGKCAKPLPPFVCKKGSKDECEGDRSCEGSTKCCFDGCKKKCQYPLASMHAS